MFPQQASWRRCSGGCLSRGILRFTTSDLHRLISGTQLAGLPPQESVAHLNARCAHARSTGHRSPVTDHSVRAGFTLLELLIVIGIIAILLVLIAPAFTTIKSGTDVTSAAYTIKGVLDTARTYAKANNTYTWVGFAGSIGPNTNQDAITGQVELAIVGSKDGTNLWSVNNWLPDNLTQVGKMTTLNNIHIGDTGSPQNNGTDFESRENVDTDHRISSSANTPYPFTVQGTTFNKWIQFSPRGEALVHGGNFSIVKAAEVGVLPTHGNALAVTQSGNLWLGNVIAIQINGFGGNVRIYRR
jgi:prepilin-type N-terminal cleavage/methylation domain-containing protein